MKNKGHRSSRNAPVIHAPANSPTRRPGTVVVTLSCNVDKRTLHESFIAPLVVVKQFAQFLVDTGADAAFTVNVNEGKHEVPFDELSMNIVDEPHIVDAFKEIIHSEIPLFHDNLRGSIVNSLKAKGLGESNANARAFIAFVEV